MLFLLLLSIAIGFTVQSHSYHKSKVISSANFLSGNIYKQINSVREYFDLRTKNDELVLENARLKGLLFNLKDSTNNINLDSIKGVKKTDIIISKVIKNSYNTQENILTISSGKKQGIKPYMGVINSLGIVGVIDDVSTNYATVVSILNVNSRLTAKLKKNNHFGTLSWDGRNTGFVQLTDLPRLATVRKGDTIVTSGYSTIFPPDFPIAIAKNVKTIKESGFQKIETTPTADINKIDYVYIVEKIEKMEIDSLESELSKPQLNDR